jgi:hypothetical protein
MENGQYKVPDFELPIITDDMEQAMAPKLISFEAYLRFIANSYKALSPQQKEHYRKLKLASPPVMVRFEI